MMTKTIQLFFILCFCLFVLSPFHGFAEDKNPAVSATVSEPGQTESDPQGTDTVSDKAVADSRQSQSTLPSVSLVNLNPEYGPATLVIRNREIITIRAEIGGLSPHARVKQFRKRFDDAVSDAELSEPIVKDIPPYGTLILVNDRPVVSIAYLDIDPLGHTSHEQVVMETVAKLSQLLSEIREERSFSTMIQATGFSLLATVALGLSIWMILFVLKFLSGMLSTKISSTKSKLERFARLDIDKTKIIVNRLAILLVTVLIIFFIFTWLAYVLKQFPYTRPWGEEVWDYVLGSMKHIGLVILNALPDLFTIALIVLITRFVAKLLAMMMNAAASGKIHIPGIYPETVKPTRRIIITVIYLFGLVAVYPYLPGSSSDAFKGLSVLIGIMVSIGGSGVINQALSGLVLMYTRAHQVGDYVRIGETEGVVVALDMLATKIRTSKKEEVTIPNSVILSTSTKNYTRLAGKEGVILNTEVTIGYSEPWRKVHEALIAAAGLTADLKKEPAPFVLQTALSDFYVAYQLNAYLEKPEKRLAVLAELHSHIQDTFNEAGIVIVSPHYVGDPPQPSPPHEELPG